MNLAFKRAMIKLEVQHDNSRENVDRLRGLHTDSLLVDSEDTVSDVVVNKRKYKYDSNNPKVHWKDRLCSYRATYINRTTDDVSKITCKTCLRVMSDRGIKC